ncbi:MAG: SLATT domain-containing protein [Shewanella sp.]|nr:SLATT domain-containing protein [Shewanella sp.]
MTDLLTKLSTETHRIEEDTEHSAKGHFNAAERWGWYHLAIGLPSAVLAAIAGGAAFGDQPEVAGSLAILSTALTTVLTFLKPSEHAENHKAVAGQYLALRNQTRLFRELDLVEKPDANLVKKRLVELANARDDLNQSSPGISRKDYEKARADIDKGYSQYRVDKEAS